jgi:DNA-binding LacI/PurR family transcriptional regulator
MWLSPGDEELETIKTLAQNGHKVILINRETDYPNTSYVTTDHEYGAKLAVEYLLEKGHRNILFIESKRDSQIKELRYQGYISAFKSTGKFSNLAPLDIDKDQYVNELETKLPEILSSDNPPSAIFLANGHYQEPVMKILKNNNIEVPDDISLISFDDMENISERYGITVIQQKLLDIGHQAFNAINGGVLKEKIKPRILLRSSVRRLNVPKDN